MTRTLIPTLVVAVAAAFAQAETPTVAPVEAPRTLSLADGASPAPARIADLSWLSGYWQGEGLGGTCEEVWGRALGDRMTGFFTLVEKGSFSFSEAITLVEEEGSLALKLKHFGPDFTGWEEKDQNVTFRLVRLGENEAFFDGLTYRRSGDTLFVYVRLGAEGKVREETFTFRRARL